MGTDLRAEVWMYAGQWVASCPAGCGNVEKFGRCDDGTTGGLLADRYWCRPTYGGCDLTCAADWPYRASEIETLVRARPRVNRNWRPGEDLLDLLTENLNHGLVPTSALEAGPSRKVMAIADNEIQLGVLEFEKHLAIGPN